MNRDLMFSSKSDLWCTPQDFFDKLNAEFHFTLDVCATSISAKCKKYFTPEQDAFKQDWQGEVCFCNPPYGREIGKWVKKCYDEAQKPNTTVVILMPSRTDTSYFHDYIYGKAEIRFIRGRLRFMNLEDRNKYPNQKISPAPFPSMLVIFNAKLLSLGFNQSLERWQDNLKNI